MKGLFALTSLVTGKVVSQCLTSCPLVDYKCARKTVVESVWTVDCNNEEWKCIELPDYNVLTHKTEVTWDAAEKACNSKYNSNLVSIPTRDFNDALKKVTNSMECYIGLFRETNWVWMDGTEYGGFMKWGGE